MSGIIKGLGGWLKNSFIDFPGTVSTVLFFNKCNLRCPYCHNPDFIHGNVSLEDLSSEVWEFLEKRKSIIGGVVLTGGEPTIFSSIVDLVDNIRRIDYKIKLDTNGLNPSRVRDVSPDYLALDIKSDFAGYEKHLGALDKELETKIIDSIGIVRKMGKKAEVRITAASDLINRDSVLNISKMIKGVSRVFIQKASINNNILHTDFFTEKKPVSFNELEEYRQILSEICDHCEIR